MFKKGFLQLKWASSRKEIVTLRRLGAARRGKNFTVRVMPAGVENGVAEPGIIVVCGKGFKNSVSRNLAKRRALGCIMDNRDLLNSTSSYLIECRRGTEKEDYQILVTEIKKLLRA